MASAFSAGTGAAVGSFPAKLQQSRYTFSNPYFPLPRHPLHLSPPCTASKRLYRGRAKSKCAVPDPRVGSHLSRCSHHDGAEAGRVEEGEISLATLLWRAVKLPIYSVALIPLTYPPFRLSYKGLGEPLCFAAFGPFATTAFFLSQSGNFHSSEVYQLPITRTVLSTSLFVGLTTTLILFCSHFHQIDDDTAVGKMSPLVRIGSLTGARVVKIAIMALYSLLLVFGFARVLPLTCIILCVLTLPMGKLVLNFVEENYHVVPKIFMAKYYCVRLHSLFGAALAAGLVLARK